MDIAMPTISFNSRRLALAAALLLAAFCAPARAQVVVVANGSPITVYDIEQRKKLIETSSHKTPTRQQVIQELIDDRIKIDKAKGYGLIVGEDEINQAFNNMAAQQHITPPQFVQFLQKAGLSPETIKARIRAELTWGQLVRGKFNSALQVAEPDIVYAMRERKEADVGGYIYTLYPVIVVVPYGTPPEGLEAKHKEAESLRSRFTSCKSGLELARSIRDVAVREPVTRSTADLPQQLRDLLGGMPLGQLTPPEATAQGLQMFALCEKKASKTESPVQQELKNEIFRRRFTREADRYLDELRKQALIEYKDESYAKDTKPEKPARSKPPRPKKPQ